MDPAAPKQSAGATAWRVVLGLDLGLLGLLWVAASAVALVAWLQPESEVARSLEGAGGQLTQGTLVVESLVLLVLAGIIPLASIAGSRVRPFEGAVAYFNLRRPARSIGLGALVAAGLVVATILIAVAYIAIEAAATGKSFEEATEQNASEQTQAITAVMTLPLAILISVSAGFGEEVLFRGILQKKLGVWGQALLFGAVHASYGTPLQIIIPLLLGLLFGMLVRRGVSLWLPIAAHTGYDLIQLSLAMYGPEWFD